MLDIIKKLKYILITVLTLLWLGIVVWGFYYQKPNLENEALQSKHKIKISIPEENKIEEALKPLVPIEEKPIENKEDSSENKLLPAENKDKKSPDAKSPEEKLPEEKASLSHESKTEIVDSRSTVNKKPKIAILIEDLGLNKALLLKALELPKEIALGVTPYIDSLEQNTKHEVYVYIPFEIEDINSDLGEFSILSKNNIGYNLEIIKKIIAFPNIQGIYSKPNETYTSRRESMEQMIELFKDLTFIQGNKANVHADLYKEKALNYLVPDIIIDQEINLSKIKNNFMELEKIALEKGSAFGILHPYQISFDSLNEFLKQIQDSQIELIPVSDLLNKK